jgi:hypothetical protein
MIARPRNLQLAAVAALSIVVLALAPIAFAGKGGGGGKPSGGGTSTGGGSISLAPVVVDANGDGLPSFGETVTFNVSTTATTQPYVNLLCYQNGVLGYNSWRGYFAGSLDSTWNFTLGSGGWTSGAADCTAWLGMYTRQGFQRLASTSFHVGP